VPSASSTWQQLISAVAHWLPSHNTSTNVSAFKNEVLQEPRGVAKPHNIVARMRDMRALVLCDNMLNYATGMP
jgi:hypothetical protein